MTRECAFCGTSFDYDENDGRSRRKQTCSDNCRKRLCAQRHQLRCADCGGPMAEGSAWRHWTRCRNCRDARRLQETAERALRIEVMWAEGWTLKRIAAEFGWSPGHMSMELDRMRAKGFNLPYRYRTGKKNATRYPPSEGSRMSLPRASR